MKINKLTLLPTNFIAFIALQMILVLMFPEKLYKIYMAVRPFFSYYYPVLIIILIWLILYYLIENFKYIKSIINRNKYLIIIIIILSIIFLSLVLHEPILVRVDKGLSAVQGINNFDIDSISFFNVIFRAKAYFFILYLLSFLMPIAIKSLVVVNTILIVFQSLLMFFILRLLLDSRVIAFWIALLFLFYPNNFLLGLAPDYALAGQVLGTFSLFTLLLYLKFKDNKILLWSLSILALSLLLRIEMVIWLFIYFLILYRSLDKEQIFRIKNIINSFLVIILPLIFPVFLLYASSPFLEISQGGNYTDPLLAEAIINKGNFIEGFTKYHYHLFEKNFVFNFNYLFTTVPLVWILLFIPFFYKKNKDIQNYFYYFIIYFFVITIFHYNEFLNSYHYLSYVIPPLIILIGLIFNKIFIKKKVEYYIVGLLALVMILICLNVLYYKPAWINNDATTILWNKEYNIVFNYKDVVKDDSVIISNDDHTLLSGILTKRKNIEIIKVKRDIDQQIAFLQRRYKDIYITQGTLSYSRPIEATFEFDKLEKIIDENFKYEAIYKRNLKINGENIPIFLCKLIF